MGQPGKESKSAILVVDLVRDFVDLKFKSPESVNVAEKTIKIAKASSGKIPIILTRDAHIPSDPEFRIWGEHCLDGTAGSEFYGDLQKLGNRIISKRHYDAFFGTDLDSYLKDTGITDLFICGISTDICVLHTVAGAFFRSYKITVLEDLCCSIEPENHKTALNTMKSIYGVDIRESSILKVI